MFKECKSLTTIPLLNTSNVIDLSGTFNTCPKLSNETLNNILTMCKMATKVLTKTLSNIGLTTEQATICKTLSNWATLQSAGWSTGY